MASLLAQGADGVLHSADQTAFEYLLFFLAAVTYEKGEPEWLFCLWQ